jgi:hypothetical protein
MWLDLGTAELRSKVWFKEWGYSWKRFSIAAIETLLV